MSPSDKQLIQTIQEGKVQDTFGLDIDAYLLPVERQHDVKSVGRPTYLHFRGYWDELWGRRKSAEPRKAMLPRRGYLEVILDEWAKS